MVNMQTVMKVVDAVVFLSLLLLALKYYALSPNVFDVITIVAMIYVMVRNRDIRGLKSNGTKTYAKDFSPKSFAI